MARRIRPGRLPWLCLTWGSLGLGAAGVFLPLLPTTPFVLLAAWAAPKASPELGDWLEKHPTFGPVLNDWRRDRAVPRRARVTGLSLLCFSWIVLWLAGASALLLALTGSMFLVLGVLLLSRPFPERERRRD